MKFMRAKDVAHKIVVLREICNKTISNFIYLNRADLSKDALSKILEELSELYYIFKNID